MLVSRGCRLDLGEFDALADDIPDLAFYHFQHAGERRAQGLFHLHHFEGEDRRALFEVGADFGQQRHHGARQRRHDLVLADLLLVVAAERIDPMQVKTAVAGAQIEFVAFDDGDDVEDPMGRSFPAYQETARILSELVEASVRLIWPGEALAVETGRG